MRLLLLLILTAFVATTASHEIRAARGTNEDYDYGTTRGSNESYPEETEWPTIGTTGEWQGPRTTAPWTPEGGPIDLDEMDKVVRSWSTKFIDIIYHHDCEKTVDFFAHEAWISGSCNITGRDVAAKYLCHEVDLGQPDYDEKISTNHFIHLKFRRVTGQMNGVAFHISDRAEERRGPEEPEKAWKIVGAILDCAEH